MELLEKTHETFMADPIKLDKALVKEAGRNPDEQLSIKRDNQP